ncbi:MAG: sugar nucleotide-binding protein [Pseudomonadota bacterium]|nr:sugar nucleotide-binding protein [Pseudomonadota bacterium]
MDEAESDPDRCFRLNVMGARILAAAADLQGIPSVTYSTDLVFDGATLTPYVESREVRPMNVYGQSKVAAEMAVADFSCSLCIRTAAFFGAGPRSDFLTDALRAIRAGRTTPAIDDVIISPTYLPDLAVATLELLLAGWTGIVHVTNQDSLSWADFARRGAEALQLDAALVDGRPLRSFGLAARRPAFSALTSERVQIMPTLADALDRYAANPIGLRKQDQ